MSVQPDIGEVFAEKPQHPPVFGHQPLGRLVVRQDDDLGPVAGLRVREQLREGLDDQLLEPGVVQRRDADLLALAHLPYQRQVERLGDPPLQTAGAVVAQGDYNRPGHPGCLVSGHHPVQLGEVQPNFPAVVAEVQPVVAPEEQDGIDAVLAHLEELSFTEIRPGAECPEGVIPGGRVRELERQHRHAEGIPRGRRRVLVLPVDPIRQTVIARLGPAAGLDPQDPRHDVVLRRLHVAGLGQPEPLHPIGLLPALGNGGEDDGSHTHADRVGLLVIGIEDLGPQGDALRGADGAGCHDQRPGFALGDQHPRTAEDVGIRRRPVDQDVVHVRIEQHPAAFLVTVADLEFIRLGGRGQQLSACLLGQLLRSPGLGCQFLISRPSGSSS
jgi:hypothetical protein